MGDRLGKIRRGLRQTAELISSAEEKIDEFL